MERAQLSGGASIKNVEGAKGTSLGGNVKNAGKAPKNVPFF